MIVKIKTDKDRFLIIDNLSHAEYDPIGYVAFDAGGRCTCSPDSACRECRGAAFKVGHDINLSNAREVENSFRKMYAHVAMPNLDLWPSAGHADNDHAHYFYNTMYLFKNDGTEISIIFDTVAYICNDNSKTLEKVDCRNNF